MRQKFPDLVEKGRHLVGDFATETGERQGVFQLRCPLTSTWLRIIASSADVWAMDGMTGETWEHVSVSNVHRCPSWEEMCWVKELFFEDEECVIQYHPPRSQYVNCHPNVLHLWRPTVTPIPMPPKECV